MMDARDNKEWLQCLMERVCQEIGQHTPDVQGAIMQLDANGCIQVLAAPGLPEACQQAIEGQSLLLVAGEDDGKGKALAALDVWQPLLQQLQLQRGPTRQYLLPLCSPDGQLVGVLALYYPASLQLEPASTNLVRLLAQFCAVTLEQDRRQTELHRLAFYNSITGLPNRTFLQKEANRLLQHLGPQQKLAVLFIDLDRFRQFNDSMGQVAGDQLLQQTAQRLRAFRQADGVAGHLSGDDFMLLQPYQQVEELTLLVERLMGALGHPCKIDDTLFTPSCSLGISVYPDDGCELDSLILRADMAMRQARQQGKDRFCFFSQELDALARENLLLEQSLQQALQQGQQLRLHYQPQMALMGDHLWGVEALLRWTHETLGPVAPDRVTAIAERSGLMGRLSDWVISTACAQLARWREQGLMVPSVSVNLSPSDFHRPELPGVILGILVDQGLGPGDLVLEITENVLLNESETCLSIFRALVRSGIRIALDDFGTGYSSLNYLNRLTVHELKLDRSFIQEIESRPSARALCESVSHIGRSLGLTVIVEGVETLGQQALLIGQGFTLAQGFLFAPPMAAADFETWFSRIGTGSSSHSETSRTHARLPATP